MKLTRSLAIPILIILAVAAFFIIRKPGKTDQQANLEVKVQSGPMAVHIHAPGELEARRSEKIKGPDGLRSVGIYQVTIANLVPEGTLVKKGEFVASLDRTELDGKIKDSQAEIDKIQTQLEQARIDTAIEMRGLRDQLVNTRFSMKEKELSLQLSQYEPEAIKQQARLDLEKAQRELDQLETKLVLTKEKSIAKIQEINASYRQQEFKLNRFMELQSGMTVTAPKDGMVIYVRDWNGKRGPGSQVSAWDPVIAELPDLSEMVSKAYINEVDISKVMPGQPASVSVDAFPGKIFEGMVLTKANIGEQLRNFDTKVFEVVVSLKNIDSLVRPAMTTGLEILVDSLPSCLYVPLEAIQNDSVTFVFKKTKSGWIRQEIVTGQSNDMYMSIEAGLEAGDEITLNPPAQGEKLTMNYLEPATREAAIAAFEKARGERMKIQQDRARTVKADDLASEQEAGGFMIIF